MKHSYAMFGFEFVFEVPLVKYVALRILDKKQDSETQGGSGFGCTVCDSRCSKPGSKRGDTGIFGK